MPNIKKGHPLYSTYYRIIAFCYNPKNKKYPRYGGRGITMCKRWKDDRELFFQDMEPGWERGLTIERINNDGNYSPENCKWATFIEQSRNKKNISLSMEKARLIRKIYKDDPDMTYEILADSFIVSESCIRSVVEMKSWKESYRIKRTLIREQKKRRPFSKRPAWLKARERT